MGDCSEESISESICADENRAIPYEGVAVFLTFKLLYGNPIWKFVWRSGAGG